MVIEQKIFSSILFVCSTASLASYAIVERTSTLNYATALVTQALRVLASGAFILICSRRSQGHSRALGFWVLTLLASSALKIHTSYLTEPLHARISASFNMVVEIAITVVCCIFTVLQTVLLPPVSWRIFTKDTQDDIEPPLTVAEDETSVLGLLSLSWLVPLLRFGCNTALEPQHLVALRTSPAAALPDANPHKIEVPPITFRVLSGLLLRPALQVLAVNAFLVAARLCQPLIVQALVKFLQNDQHQSLGRWLVAATFFE